MAHPSIVAMYTLKATVRDLRRAYKKDDPFLIMTLENARRIFLSGKRAVKELHSPNRMDHWIGHAIAAKSANGMPKIKGYCKHRIKGSK